MLFHLILFAIIFMALFLTFLSNNLFTKFKDNVTVSAVASVCLIGLMYVIGYFLPDKNAGTPEATIATTGIEKSTIPYSAGSRPSSDESKTIYIENYKRHGDAPVGIRCYQDGSQIKCVPAK